MAGQYNAQMYKTSTAAGREIKASAHYTYIENGITLDGSKFAAGALIVEGQCLVKDDTTKKYEPYLDGGTVGAPVFPTGKSNPVVLDTSVKFEAIEGTNLDVVVGAVMVHGAVHEGMLVGVTKTFKTAVGGAIRFV